MTEMRHEAVDLSGYLYCRGKLGLTKKKLYFRLEAQVLYGSKAKEDEPTSEISLAHAQITCSMDTCTIKIKKNRKRMVLYPATKEECELWFTGLQKASLASLENFYELGEKLGEGAFATVHVGLDKSTLEKFAVKVIDKGKTDNEVEFIHREMRIMRVVDHPNVIRTYDIFDTKTHLYLVMEHMAAGTLADLMKNKVIRTERIVREVMADILHGVDYLHKNHIVHRDLKLKNILCKNLTSPFGTKLADFGLSNNCGLHTISRIGLKSQVGSPHFVAPEVLREHPYGPKIDVWSCGVIIHFMLTGTYPFAGKTVQETLERVCEGTFSMTGSQWDHVTDAGKDFVKQLLKEKAEDRFTAEEALQHPWLNQAKSVKRRESVRQKSMR